MKKTILTFLATFLLFFNATSQEQDLQKLFKADFNFLGIGLSYELPISKKWTVDFSTGFGGGYRVDDGFAAEWILNSTPATYFKSEFKYYNNREKRFQKGRDNSNNSGNYWAFQTKFASQRLSESDNFVPLNNVLLNEIHWGLQRSLGGNWLFNTHFGLGLAADFNYDTFTLYPAIGIKFSHILFKKQKQ